MAHSPKLFSTTININDTSISEKECFDLEKELSITLNKKLKINLQSSHKKEKIFFGDWIQEFSTAESCSLLRLTNHLPLFVKTNQELNSLIIHFLEGGAEKKISLINKDLTRLELTLLRFIPELVAKSLGHHKRCVINVIDIKKDALFFKILPESTSCLNLSILLNYNDFRAHIDIIIPRETLKELS